MKLFKGSFKCILDVIGRGNFGLLSRCLGNWYQAPQNILDNIFNRPQQPRQHAQMTTKTT